MEQDFSHLCGWHNNPEEIQRIVSSLPKTTMLMSDITDSGKGKTTLLYKCLLQVVGKYNVRLQTIGDCFNPSAMVRMSDGSEKQISDIIIGDEVITPQGNVRKVIDKISKPYNGNMVRIHVAGYHKYIDSTPDHKYMVEFKDDSLQKWFEWESAENLSLYQNIFLSPNDGLGDGFGKIRKIEIVEPETNQVYCIGVEKDHAFICNGYGVHNCVSMGAAGAVDLLRCVQHVLLGTAEQWIAECATEPIYAGSRVEIAGGQLGGGDGSNGIWAVQYLQKYGVLLRQKYGNIDLTRYSGERARQWGMPRAGVPDELEPIARLHPVKTFTQVSTWEQCRDAIYNGYPVTVACGRGFGNSRDREGFITGNASWPHQQHIIAMKDDDRPGALILNSWGCYSDDTEVLTNNGWKLFKDLNQFDMIATLNKHNNLEFQYPEKYHKYNVNTKLIRFKGRNVDLLVTDNHNMLAKPINSDKYSLIQAKDMFIDNKAKFKLKKNCNGVYNGHVLYHTIGNTKIEMNKWLEFLGYFLTKGSAYISSIKRKKRKRIVLCDGKNSSSYIDGEYVCEKQYHTTISQSKSSNVHIMKTLFNDFTYKFTYNSIKNFSCSKKEICKELLQYGKSYEKYIPDYVWDCSKEQLKILYNAMMLGDGTRNNNKNVFYTSSSRMAGDFQRLLLSIGYSGDISIVDRVGQKTTSGNNRNHIEYQVKIKEVYNETMPQHGWKKEEHDYIGDVYCVTVPNHVLYVRRNGNAVWSGNSDWVGGPKGKYEDIPEGSYWVDARILERDMLSAGDSWAISNFEGFPPQKLSLELF